MRWPSRVQPTLRLRHRRNPRQRRRGTLRKARPKARSLLPRLFGRTAEVASAGGAVARRATRGFGCTLGGRTSCQSKAASRRGDCGGVKPGMASPDCVRAASPARNGWTGDVRRGVAAGETYGVSSSSVSEIVPAAEGEGGAAGISLIWASAWRARARCWRRSALGGSAPSPGGPGCEASPTRYGWCWAVSASGLPALSGRTGRGEATGVSGRQCQLAAHQRARGGKARRPAASGAERCVRGWQSAAVQPLSPGPRRKQRRRGSR